VVRAAGPLIHLGTRCGSLEEFVERFAPFTTETSLVIPAVNNVKVGTEGRFIIRLKDQSAAMSGRCRVEDVRRLASGPGDAPLAGRMVMRVRLLEMDEASRNLHKQLLAHKRPAPSRPAVAPKPPLRIVRAPTLIGTAPPPIGTAPTLIGTVPPPLPAVPTPISEGIVETTERSTLPGTETRAPAASFTLPANPLSDLEAGDLSSFVECTLFEADHDADPAETPASDAKTPVVIGAEPKPAAPSPATAAQAAPADAPLEGARARLRRNLLHAAPFALCTVIGVLGGLLLRGAATAPPAASSARNPPAPSSPPPATAPPPATESSPATAATRPVVVAAGTSASATTMAGRAKRAASPTNACSASITTEPDDATILWGTRSLGRSPLRNVPVPCGDATLTIRHERYRDTSHPVHAEADRAVVVSERLKRPMGTLVLTSSPTRAVFTVNAQALGPGPRKLNTWRFEHVRVDATLPGYQPWHKTLYLKDPVTRLNAQLASAPRPRTILSR
jgi:hypothetical protein